MSKREPILYLQDIFTSIEKIEDYTKGLSYKTFSKDEKTIDAVVRNLEIIGEATRNIPKEITDKYSGIPWGKMISMRNKAVHEYFGVDTEILWQTIEEDLPALKEQIQRVLEEIDNA